MKIHPWKDIRNSAIAPERRDKIAAAVGEEIRLLRELEEGLGITQQDLERLANITHDEATQLEISDAPRAERLEQIRRLVEALGGRLEVYAVLRDKRMRVG